MRTKRTLVILIFQLILVGGVEADWITVGSDMYADITGNVGIGTTTPEEILTVYGGTVKSRNNYNGGKAIYGLSFGSGGEAAGVYGEATGTGDMVNYGGYFKAAGDWGIGVYGEATSTASGLTDPDSPSSYRPDYYGGYFQAMGTRGVGVYAKGGKLAAHFDGLVKFTLGEGGINMSTPGGWPGIIAFSPNGNRRDITYADWGLSIAVSSSFSPPPYENSIIISEAGNVGVGMTTLPPQKLSVNGRIGLTDVPVWDGTDDNDLTWDGFAIGREGSSRRYKQNIHPFEEDFRKILKLKVKQFQMKEGYGNPEKDLFGYIAEELEDVGLTKLVNHDAEGRPDGIKYKKMAIYLNEIVKEHDRDIAELKSEIGKRQVESSMPSIAEDNDIVTSSPKGKLTVTGSVYIEQLQKRITILEEKLAKLEAGMNARE